MTLKCVYADKVRKGYDFNCINENLTQQTAMVMSQNSNHIQAERCRIVFGQHRIFVQQLRFNFWQFF
jgi:hypothetical protein